MNFKITTLTPVHVGTGEKNLSILYHPGQKNILNCYNFNELLKSIPKDKLLNLEIINPSNQGKRAINNLFNQYVDYSQTPIKYSLKNYDGYNIKDVSEHIKSANRPYIPGSSIKGAIMNCIIYAMLKDKKTKIKSVLNEIQYIKQRQFESTLFTKLYDKDFNDIFTLFSSCIICHDLYYDQLLLCSSQRLNMGNNSPKFQNIECIDINLVTIDNLIEINENKKNVFINKYRKKLNDEYNILTKFLNINNIIITCSDYYRHLIEEEKDYFIKDSHNYFVENDFEGRYEIASFLNQLSFDDKNIFYLRIGSGTNYFYKSVSLYIKKIYLDYYEQNFRLFSPVGLKNKVHPSYDTMPKTRTVVTTNNHTYLAGYLKIEKID